MESTSPYSDVCFQSEAIRGTGGWTPETAEKFLVNLPASGAFKLDVFMTEEDSRVVFDCPMLGLFADGTDQVEAWRNFQEVLNATREYLHEQGDESTLAGKLLLAKRVFEFGYSFEFSVQEQK